MSPVANRTLRTPAQIELLSAAVPRLGHGPLDRHRHQHLPHLFPRILLFIYRQHLLELVDEPGLYPLQVVGLLADVQDPARCHWKLSKQADGLLVAGQAMWPRLFDSG